MVMSTVRESGWSVPLAMAEEDMDQDSGSDGESIDDAPPIHPVPTMQGAFEESMTETMNEADEPGSPDRYSKADSVTRRKMLLEQAQYERTVAGRWKQKPGEKFHPLWKLVAQISFGMHLLQQGLAKSDEEVLKILQTHVDEVDGFLERTTEDFDLAQGDINERIRYLKLPLEHGQVFDQMLADRNFRAAIVEGNEKIEHIIDRTAAAMNDALKDVQKGLDATRELAKYMTRVDKLWEDRTEEHDSVYLAMIGNTEGWTRAFLTLQSKGGHLRKALVQLGAIVAEMQRRAGAASRKNLVPAKTTTNRYNVDVRADSPQQNTPPRSPMKPLPNAPDPVTRMASSQKYIKTSTPRSATSSPSTTETIRPAPRKESVASNKSANPVVHSKSPDPSRFARSPTPDKMRKDREANIGLGLVSVGNAGPTRSTTGTPEPGRSAKSPPPQHQHRAGSPEVSRPYLTPGQIMAKMTEGPIGSSAKPSIPQRSGSQRKSLQDRTRSILLGRKPSWKRDDKEARSGTNLPIQAHSGGNSPDKSPSSPKTITTIKRLSSRKANAHMSMSTYSSSPTSPDWPNEEPVVREASPVYLREGQAVPTQSSYGTLAFLPMQPRLSPFDPSFPSKSDSPTKADRPQRGPPPVPTTAANGSERNVNAEHPLLQEARHTRRGSGSAIGTPGNRTPKDLPLRHYHSQIDLSIHKREPTLPPQRASSLLYTPDSRDILLTDLRPPKSQESLRAEQTTPNASTLNILSRATTSPAQGDLGVHPAHRTPELSTEHGTASSAHPSHNSSPFEGATPPPIATMRSPPVLFASSPPNQNQASSSTNQQGHPRTDSPQLSKPPSSQPTSPTTQTPFYLNPASSSALVDFLASTPPPSPPHVGTRTEPGTPQSATTTAFFSRPFNPPADASPPPPGPGSARGAHRQNGDNDSAKGKKGWKKVFGGSKNAKERMEKGRRKKGAVVRKEDEAANIYMGPPGGVTAPAGGEGGEGFMGVGSDGVWISRKNFVKT